MNNLFSQEVFNVLCDIEAMLDTLDGVAVSDIEELIYHLKGACLDNGAKIPVSSIIIRGLRWFQKSCGNTYFSASIEVDGEIVHTIEYEYGYGDYYLQVAWEWLSENGYVSPKRYDWGGLESPTIYCREHGIDLDYYVSDVSRKKDL